MKHNKIIQVFALSVFSFLHLSCATSVSSSEKAIARYESKSDTEVKKTISQLPFLASIAASSGVSVSADAKTLREVALKRGFYSGKKLDAIKSKNIYKGMPEAEMILALGGPVRLNSSSSNRKQYVFKNIIGNTRYVYISKGNVTSWDTFQ